MAKRIEKKQIIRTRESIEVESAFSCLTIGSIIELLSKYNLDSAVTVENDGWSSSGDTGSTLIIHNEREETDEEFQARLDMIAEQEANLKAGNKARKLEREAQEKDTLRKLAKKYKVKLDKEL